eukprot:5214901-Alexandrium_andersonii.AAC.1
MVFSSIIRRSDLAIVWKCSPSSVSRMRLLVAAALVRWNAWILEQIARRASSLTTVGQQQGDQGGQAGSALTFSISAIRWDGTKEGLSLVIPGQDPALILEHHQHESAWEVMVSRRSLLWGVAYPD